MDNMSIEVELADQIHLLASGMTFDGLDSPAGRLLTARMEKKLWKLCALAVEAYNAGFDLPSIDY